MKKSVKVKAAKKSSKRSKAALATEPELPSLVTAMAKFLERLESMERKMDQVLGRVSNLPSEIRNVVQNLPRSQSSSSYQPQQSSSQNPERSFSHSNNPSQQDNRRERVMYQAICDDCEKNCEVPFKPTGDRPVYCKECFAIRKSGGGGAAQKSVRYSDATQPQRKPAFVPSPMTQSSQASAVLSGNPAVARNKKQNSKKTSSTQSKKKKK